MTQVQEMVEKTEEKSMAALADIWRNASVG